jgi:katanin p80 WD40 repeat-containing subunit B1
MWDFRKNECMQTYRGHTAGITSGITLPLTFVLHLCLLLYGMVVRHSPDGKWAVSGDSAGIVKIWDLTAAKLLHEIKTPRREPITCIEFHPAELLLAIGSGMYLPLLCIPPALSLS